MYNTTKKKIDGAIYTNNNGEVTAHNLNTVLHEICDVTDIGKQDYLVSGKNIKKINGQDIMGEGNISFPVDSVMSSKSTNPVQNLVVKDYIDSIEEKNKGYYSSIEVLTKNHPKPRSGSRAYVGESYPYEIFMWDTEKRQWVNSGETGGDDTLHLGEYYTKDTVDATFVNKDQIKEYSTTEQVKSIINSGYEVLTLEEYEKLPVKENKLYFVIG